MRSAVTCTVIRPSQAYDGKQGLTYLEGVSAESTGALGISMHMLTIPPGGRAHTHLHQTHETAIYVLTGESEMWFGDDLGEHLTVRAGEFLYIPANVPHLPMNTADQPCTCILARTDPNEQESVVLLPELERFVPGA